MHKTKGVPCSINVEPGGANGWSMRHCGTSHTFDVPETTYTNTVIWSEEGALKGEGEGERFD